MRGRLGHQDWESFVIQIAPHSLRRHWQIAGMALCARSVHCFAFAFLIWSRFVDLPFFSISTLCSVFKAETWRYIWSKWNKQINTRKRIRYTVRDNKDVKLKDIKSEKHPLKRESYLKSVYRKQSSNNQYQTRQKWYWTQWILITVNTWVTSSNKALNVTTTRTY